MSENALLPKISIVLPSYNRAGYIDETIESCIGQSFKDWELIVVDDASKDNSVDVIKKFMARDRRIGLIQNKFNRKLPASLNIGFSQAKGEYFTWISDDNLFHKESLATMQNYLDLNPKIGLVYTDYTLIDERGKVGKYIYQEEPAYLPIRDCVGASFLYRSNIARQVGNYNEKMFLIEDYEYWLRMGLVTQFHHIKESLYFYRKHKDALTNTRKEEIRKAKNLLKKLYASKYEIPTGLKPIADLYECYIGNKNISNILKFIKTVLSSPLITLRYILKNLRRRW